MQKKCVFILLLVGTLLFSLSSCKGRAEAKVQKLNTQAYRWKYANVDSSMHYATLAYVHPEATPDDRAEALGHMSFVFYQRMCFSQALLCLEQLDSITHNQVELLCADVMRMKISQRTGELCTLYRSWHSAEKRLERIDEEYSLLSQHLQERVVYARTEMNLIAATYYYYAQQDSLLRQEIAKAEPYMKLPTDTAQWCSYMYLLGTCKALSGDSISTTVNEFDNLTHVYTIASKRNYRYFQANSLQALALLMENPSTRRCLSEHRGGGMEFIKGLVANSSTQYSSDSLSYALAQQSLSLFQEYGDRFQTANVLRTKAELLFRQSRYEDAQTPLSEALAIIEEQHSIEKKRVPYWEAFIYERMSLVYSALGNHTLALDYRSRYLEMLRVMRQDLEENLRMEELRSYNNRLYLNLAIILLLVISVCVAFWVLLRKLKKHGLQRAKEAEETQQIILDETIAREMQLSREKLANIERRAKVSLAELVVPYIHRMLKSKDMEYASELSAGIIHLNDILTDWILVRPGKLAMNISSFPLQPILDTISKNTATFSRKGITLQVPTECPYTVKADRALTLFMINTLCDNARKFTPSGGRVWIDIRCVDDYVEISVHDTGCGISQSDVEKINNSKVLRLSNSQRMSGVNGDHDTAGFGFGLMNCKGIIGQMRKISSRFQSCAFGVESVVGQGSRFWFRLPRVLSLVLLFLSAQYVCAVESDSAEEHYRLMLQDNADFKHERAMEHGKKALMLVHKDSLRLRMQIENEMAIASQSLCRWDEYKFHNRQCRILYSHLTDDPNLPSYARRLHLVKSELSLSWYFIFLFFLLSISFLVLMIRRSRRLRDSRELQAESIRRQREQFDRVQYELDRLHIQNRILDNCLSTIKHETMYYPSRIRQMALAGRTSAGDVDYESLEQLMNYYNDIYTILLAQAQRQTANKVSLDDSVLSELRRRILASIGSPAEVSFSVRDIGNIKEVRIAAQGKEIPVDLFTPEAGNLDAFVAREIVRLHDAACGYPGLRLYVENNEIIITLWKNSRLLSSKTFSWN